MFGHLLVNSYSMLHQNIASDGCQVMTEPCCEASVADLTLSDEGSIEIGSGSLIVTERNVSSSSVYVQLALPIHYQSRETRTHSDWIVNPFE